MASGLARAEALLLLQTKSVLSRPWCLLEIDAALLQHKPIVCLCIDGGGYDFGEAKTFLNDLEGELRRHDASALRELRYQLGLKGQTVHGLQSRLSAAIPSMISVPFNPSGSDHHLAAVIAETQARIAAVRSHMREHSGLFRPARRASVGGTPARKKNRRASMYERFASFVRSKTTHTGSPSNSPSHRGGGQRTTTEARPTAVSYISGASASTSQSHSCGSSPSSRGGSPPVDPRVIEMSAASTMGVHPCTPSARESTCLDSSCADVAQINPV